MRLCCAVDCKNNGIHMFPNDIERRKEWVKAIKIKGWVPNNNSRLCAAHFKQEDYHITNSYTGDPNLKRFLKKTAVPSASSSTQDEASEHLEPSRKKACIETSYDSDPELRCIEKEEDLFNPTQKAIRKVYSNEKALTIKKYGPCRCCLNEDIHTVGNVWDMLECFNVQVSTDPGISMLVCAECSSFLLQAKSFRDMVATSQDTLLAALPREPGQAVVKMEFFTDTEQDVKEEIKDDVIFPPAVEQPEEELGKIREEADPIILTSDDGQKLNTDGVDQGSDAADEPEIDEEPENEMPATSEELKRMERVKEAQLNLQIRENLTTILHHSTVIPFANRGDKYECIYCDNAYPHFKELRVHVENHNEDFEFKLQAFKLLALKLELELILRVDISVIKCKLCDERFKTIDNLVEHLVKAHEKIYHKRTCDPPHNLLCFDMSLNVFKCLDCGQTFNAVRRLFSHMNQHYGSYLCFICGSKFVYENCYKLHLFQEKVKKEKRRCECPVCGATYTTMNHLKRHMKVKHPGEEL